MRFTEIKMRERASEELSKLGETPLEISKLIGCPSSLVKYWLDQEGVPSHFYLNKLYELGCDILYIITGVKQHGN